MHNRRLASIAAVALITAGCSETKPDCMGTAQVCSGSCVELKSDNLNCGACGTACSAGHVCSNGACAVTCAAGLLNCGGHCIDTATDRTFCGASGSCVNPNAGAMCGGGQLCSAGQCVQNCSDAQAACPAASPTYCADLRRDANNCGACGAACAAGQQCVTSGGTTACACPPATPSTCGSGAFTFCTNTATDPFNCGGCGVVCPQGQQCSASQCTGQNAFTGALTITSANPAGNTTCLATSTVVITAAGVDVHTVTVAGGDCLSFTNADTANHRPATIGTPACPELNSPTLAAGATFTTAPLSGPKGCTWQDALNPPPTGGGGGY